MTRTTLCEQFTWSDAAGPREHTSLSEASRAFEPFVQRVPWGSVAPTVRYDHGRSSAKLGGSMKLGLGVPGEL